MSYILLDDKIIAAMKWLRKKWVRKVVLIATDFLLSVILFLFCCWASYDNSIFSPSYLSLVYSGLIWAVLINVVFWIFGIYKMQMSNIGLFESARIALIAFCVDITMYLLLFFTQYMPFLQIPWILNWRVFLLFIIIHCFVLVAARFSLRALRSARNMWFNRGKNIKTIVIGAGAAGKLVIDESRNNPDSHTKVVAILDDSPSLIGSTLRGISILGPISEVEKFVNETGAEEVIIAIPSSSEERFHEILKYLRPCNVRIRKLPLLSEMEKVHEMKVMDVDYQELLGRPDAEVDEEGIKALYKDSVTMIIGAAGSVGQGLSKAIAKLKCKKIVLVDHNETALVELGNELRKETDVAIEPCLIDREDMVRDLMERHRPNIVFHSGASKHVPLSETHPKISVLNNIFGTYYVAKYASEFGVKKVIYLSTSKAGEANNVMSLTKRYGERVCEHFACNSGTSFAIVRFGNVLASAGSVAPIFAKQIEQGGPITVTSLDASRSFSSLNEVVALLLQTSLYSNGGQIFELHSGSPIKIVHVAEQMIRQAGYIPYKDIDIVVHGLRAGESLENKEKDLSSKKPTDNPRIFELQNGKDYPIEKEIESLSRAMRLDDDTLKKTLLDLVKE